MFICSAANLLEGLKGLDAFRKGDPRNGIAADAIFFVVNPGGLTISALQSRTFLDCAIWLPASAGTSGDFSLSFRQLFAFVKGTKGKGWISYSSGKLSSANGVSVTLTAGPALADHPNIPSDKGHSLADILALEGPTVGINLAPFLTAAAFCSDDENKRPLTGVQWTDGSLAATDGFSLREMPAVRPAYSKAETLPADAWLPAWLAPMVTQFRKPAKAGDCLAFFFAAKQGRHAIRFCSDSGLIVACQFPERLFSFPNCKKLFPANIPYGATVHLPSLIDKLKDIVSALKGSDGNPHVRLSWDGPIGELALSAKLERKNGGSNYLPTFETVGHHESSLSATFQDFAADPRLDDGFYDLPESQQEVAVAKYEHYASFVVNAYYLLKVCKSFVCDGDSLSIAWTNSHSAITFNGGVKGSRALLMPVQTRR